MTEKEKQGLDNPAFVIMGEDNTTTTTTDVDIEIEEDIWALPEFREQFTPWGELSTRGKLKRLFLHYILKVILLIGALYIFICSLSFLGDSFQLLGGKAAGKAFSDIEVLSNPVAGLMIGVLATVLLQSSSTTTSIVVSMVGSGDLLTVSRAIPIVMGANIGTSVTNTIVSMGQITNKDDFRRAFAGATVHDAFNWLTVIVLLPIEIATGYLEKLSQAVIDSIPEFTENQSTDKDYLKTVTNPFTKLIIQIDKNVIKAIAQGDEEAASQSVIKHDCCEKGDNGTEICEPCKFLFESVSRNGGWSDAAVGAVLLAIALILLCTCLVLIVKLLHSLLRGQIAHVIRKFVNANFPGKVCGYFTGYLAIIIGAGLTILVQSSSIFTSSITPLVGMGVLSLDRMYPLTLGSNLGTTATSILAAFAQDGSTIPNALQIAFCHLFFNISGILLFYPIPLFRPPIKMSKFLGMQTAKYRWFALVYLLFAFFLLPAAVFGLSLASWIAVAAVMTPLAVLLILVLIIKLIQNKWPSCLPVKLRNWKWLPKPLRSLEPMDRALMGVTGNCYCCRKMGCFKELTTDTEDEKKVIGSNSQSSIDVELSYSERSSEYPKTCRL